MYENHYYAGVNKPVGLMIQGYPFGVRKDVELPYVQSGDFVWFREQEHNILNPDKHWALVVDAGEAYYFDPDKVRIYASADIKDIVARGAVRCVISPCAGTTVEQVVDQIKRLPEIQSKDAFTELFDYVWMSNRLLRKPEIERLMKND